MMRYTVVWLQDALDDLTWMWLASDDRAEITTATARLDAALASDPGGSGETVAEGIRRLAIPPLMAFFDIRAEDRIVEVVRVRRVRSSD